jgi:hypothetical protein
MLTKPAFNLIKPGSVGGRKVQMHVELALEPAVVLGLVGIEIVEDDVNLLFLSIGFDDAVHEIRELPASPTFVMTGIDQSMAVSSAANSVVMPCLLYSWAKPETARPLGKRM